MNKLEVLKKISYSKTTLSKKEKEILKEYKNAIEEKDNFFSLNINYKLGEVIYKKGGVFLKPFSKYSLKEIEIQDSKNINQGDIVLAKRKISNRGKIVAEVTHLIKKSLKKELLVYKDSSFILLKDLTKIDLPIKFEENQIIEYDFNKKEYKKLGFIDDAKIDQELSLKLFNKKGLLYPKIDEDKIDSLFKKELKKRKDLTYIDFCTIDPVGAKDHDDAVYYDSKNNILYVAIADVSFFVEENSTLDKDAKERAFSIYFPDNSIPMLPPILSQNYCSLLPSKKRLAYVFKIYLDKKLKVEKFKLFEAVIEVKRKYTYEIIDNFIQGNLKEASKEDKEIFKKSLQPLYRVAKRLRSKRLQQGLEFENAEVRLNLENCKIKSIYLEKSTPSHMLIEECMLLANQSAAKILIDNFVDKGIFRIHNRPKYSKIEEFIDKLSKLGFKIENSLALNILIKNIQHEAKKHNLLEEIDTLLITMQQQAIYSNTLEEHFGLGFKYYSHFTSPIRRYSDLVLHRILKTKTLPKNLEEVCDEITQKEREIANLDFDYKDRKFARWALENKNKSFLAVIVDDEEKIAKIKDLNIKVYLDDLQNAKLFDKVKIKILDADIISKEILGCIDGKDS